MDARSERALPNELRDRADRTQGDVSATLDEIQRRLTPEYAAEQATDTLRETTTDTAERLLGDTDRATGGLGTAVADAIAEHPLTAAGIGLGALWLLSKMGLLPFLGGAAAGAYLGSRMFENGRRSQMMGDVDR